MNTLRISLVCLLLSGCMTNTPPSMVTIKTEYPIIPVTLTMIPPHPVLTEPPTNGSLLLYTKALERTLCEVERRYRETIRYATNGQQTLTTTKQCLRKQPLRNT